VEQIHCALDVAPVDAVSAFDPHDACTPSTQYDPCGHGEQLPHDPAWPSAQAQGVKSETIPSDVSRTTTLIVELVVIMPESAREESNTPVVAGTVSMP
jgi:hypothetical protein